MNSSFILDYFSDDHEANVLKWERLCNHPKKSYPLTASDLKLAYCFVVCNCAEQSSQRRHRIFNNLERLLLRMRNSAAHFVKAADDPVSVEALESYECFLRDLKSVAFHYLSQSTANFNRRISALSIMKALYCDVPLTDNNFDLRVHFRMFEWLGSGDIESLVSCLDDSFQLCQQAAFDILVTSKLTEEQFDFLTFVADTKKRLLDIGDVLIVPSNFRLRLVCTKMPAEIPRVLRDILSLCEEILTESALSADGADSLVAVVERSPYVLLTAVEDVLIVHFRHRKARIDGLLEEIDGVCHKFTTIVSPVCHDLSPEGYLPPECLASLAGPDVSAEMAARLHTNFAQRLLVCCWRTHKCVSAILGLIATEASYPEEVDAPTIRRTGDYLWLQLTECRHRGAFECAAQAFRDVCARLWALHRSTAGAASDPALVTPALWLNRVIDALRGAEDSLCSTRRSAGLPHLVSVILATAKVKRNFHHLNETLDFLLDCRRLEPRLEVHCVNVLKTLFSHTQLANGVVAHVEPALRVCYDGYRSANWAVRNAHSQFFTALVRRVFGIPRSAERTLHIAACNKLTSHNFFGRHPSIYAIMLAHVNSPTADRPDIATFPVLMLLTHLQRSVAALESQFPLAPFVPGVLSIMLSSPQQKVRELAAVALIAVAEESQLLKILRAVLRQLDEMKRWPPQNQIDGLLNMLKAMAQQNLFAESEESLAVAERLLDRLLPGLLECRNDFTLSAALTLIREVGSASLKRDALSRVLVSGWQPIDGGDCIRLVSWRSAARPIGALIADLSAPADWRQISRAAVVSSVLGSHSSDVGTALAEIRWEAYRAFIRLDLPISSHSKMAVYADLICDLHEYDEEHRLKTVIALLARERDYISKLRTTISPEDIDRCEEICESRHETCLNLLRLRLVICSPVAEELIEKADTLLSTILTKSDDERSRLAALRFVDDHPDENMGRLLETACMALKDESQAIRRYASKILLRRLAPSMSKVSLNSEICWSFALDRFPDLPSRLADATNTSDAPSDLFGASPDNTFAETFGIFEFNRVKELLLAENI